MRKHFTRSYHWTSLASCLCAASTFAQDLVSRPVGYVKIDVPAESQVLAALPFDPFSDSVAGVIGSQLPEGSVSMWDAATSEYKIVHHLSGQWLDQSGAVADLELLAGDGFWLKNESDSKQQVYLSGSVVLDEARTYHFLPALSLFGPQYVSSIAFSNSGIQQAWNSDPSSQDTITDPTGELTEGGVLIPGHGYWYHRVASDSLAIDEGSPYDNPFSLNGDSLVITHLISGESGTVLTIQVTPGTASIDVFYKDIFTTESVVLGERWVLAVPSVEMNGQTTFEWLDTTSNTGAIGRLYMVARADIDVSDNGVPDAREQFVGGNQQGLSPSEGDVSASLCDSSIDGSDSHMNVSTRIIYVDAATGKDEHDGFSRDIRAEAGPKKTFAAACEIAKAGDVIEVYSGRYRFQRMPDGVRMVCRGHVVF